MFIELQLHFKFHHLNFTDLKTNKTFSITYSLSSFNANSKEFVKIANAGWAISERGTCADRDEIESDKQQHVETHKLRCMYGSMAVIFYTITQDILEKE